MNMTETINRIKRAGATRVRAVPMPGQPAAGGLYQIEVMEGSTWQCVTTGLPQSTANDLIKQAGNRIICG